MYREMLFGKKMTKEQALKELEKLKKKTKITDRGKPNYKNRLKKLTKIIYGPSLHTGFQTQKVW